MVKVNDADGKTQETAIRIVCAEDRSEGWEYIRNYITALKPCVRFCDWESQYIHKTEEDGFETQYVSFRHTDDQIWFDTTWLYNNMR